MILSFKIMAVAKLWGRSFGGRSRKRLTPAASDNRRDGLAELVSLVSQCYFERSHRLLRLSLIVRRH